MMALSPLDGRYQDVVADLSLVLSEFGLMKARAQVEVQWLIFLSDKQLIPALPDSDVQSLKKTINEFSAENFSAIKDLEKTTKHDVKAVELWLRTVVPATHHSYLHLGCTSEDINSTAYSLVLTQAREVLEGTAKELYQTLRTQAQNWAEIPLLARTHGQPATPTTLGKEWAVFALRWQQGLERQNQIPLTAKFSGATGNWAAHHWINAKADWPVLTAEFVTDRLGIPYNGITTQIEPHDNLARWLNEIGILSSIAIDHCRDTWGYISLGYFTQQVVSNEVGSSTMPHKVNPINFENAEGNFKLARSWGQTLSHELSISRWQRDLTDSTLQRNLGVVLGHFLLAMKSWQQGLNKIKPQITAMESDLAAQPMVLLEAVQTALRQAGVTEAYDLAKALSRGQDVSLLQIRDWIGSLPLEDSVKKSLQALEPKDYLGQSVWLAKKGG